MREKHKVAGELLLIIVLVINSMGVQFMTKSGFGISAISSVPYVFSKIFTFFTFGTWNYIFQGMLAISLMVMVKKLKPSYIVSFMAGFFFGKFLDVHAVWMSILPNGIMFRFIYFLMGMICLGFGIALANKCLMPIIPTDMFPRDFASICSVSYSKVKTIFDLSCLATTVILSVAFCGGVEGIGAGTVICSLLTGKVVSLFQSVIEKHITVYRFTEKHSFTRRRGRMAF